jgi:hypothetical protein
MTIGVVRDWEYKTYPDKHFREHARKFASMPSSRMRKKGFRTQLSRSDQKQLLAETLYTRSFDLGYTLEIPLADRIDTPEKPFSAAC